MKISKSSEQLTDAQLYEVYSNLRKATGYAPTVEQFISETKEKLGIAACKKRMCGIKAAFEERLSSAVPALDSELEIMLTGAILKFTNTKIGEITSSLEQSLVSLSKDYADLTVEFEREKNAKLSNLKLVTNLTSQLEAAKVVISERDNQIDAMTTQLQSREAAAAQVYTAQLEQRIQENLSLKAELERVQSEFIAKLTELAQSATRDVA